MVFSTDTVKMAGRPESRKRTVLISSDYKPRTTTNDPNRYRGVKKIATNPVPVGGFQSIQTSDLRDIERRKRNAIIAAQKKAAAAVLAARSAKPKPIAKPDVPKPAVVAAEPVAPTKRRAGRPRKSESPNK